ncbi:hypothetical protein V6N11_077918 [Hibiscus sabdariffa]|uniref:Uncharacterized protein n=1 Tax=Hibiscus sabdariffa TaxID=183260 RepID=A0ABR2TEQ3_9ROSI
MSTGGASKGAKKKRPFRFAVSRSSIGTVLGGGQSWSVQMGLFGMTFRKIVKSRDDRSTAWFLVDMDMGFVYGSSVVWLTTIDLGKASIYDFSGFCLVVEGNKRYNNVSSRLWSLSMENGGWVERWWILFYDSGGVWMWPWLFYRRKRAEIDKLKGLRRWLWRGIWWSTVESTMGLIVTGGLRTGRESLGMKDMWPQGEEV